MIDCDGAAINCVCLAATQYIYTTQLPNELIEDAKKMMRAQGIVYAGGCRHVRLVNRTAALIDSARENVSAERFVGSVDKMIGDSRAINATVNKKYAEMMARAPQKFGSGAVRPAAWRPRSCAEWN